MLSFRWYSADAKFFRFCFVAAKKCRRRNDDNSVCCVCVDVLELYSTQHKRSESIEFFTRLNYFPSPSITRKRKSKKFAEATKKLNCAEKWIQTQFTHTLLCKWMCTLCTSTQTDCAVDSFYSFFFFFWLLFLLLFPLCLLPLSKLHVVEMRNKKKTK